MTQVPTNRHLMKMYEEEGTGHAGRLLKYRLPPRNLINDCFRCVNCGGHCYSTNSYILLEFDYQSCVYKSENDDCEDPISGIGSGHIIRKVEAGTRLDFFAHSVDPGHCNTAIWATTEKINVEWESSVTSNCGDTEVVSKYVAVSSDCTTHPYWWISFHDDNDLGVIDCHAGSWQTQSQLADAPVGQEGCGLFEETGDKEECVDDPDPDGSSRNYSLIDIAVKENMCCKDLSWQDHPGYVVCDGETQEHPDEFPRCPCNSTLSYSGENFDICGDDGNECTECDNDDCPEEDPP